MKLICLDIAPVSEIVILLHRQSNPKAAIVSDKLISLFIMLQQSG